MLEDLQLVTKDHELHIGVLQFVGGAGEQPDHAAQRRMDKCEERVANLPREGRRHGRSVAPSRHTLR
jgi:hypothetical protein